uniref:Uncharacterized protein n=1 Tax=Pristhesancus plagipennis TaxID=1955184 RepID=A0A2K8JRY4_PRIPG|nr:secreted hypothetical protein [Pristhesancus plagipennis]
MDLLRILWLMFGIYTASSSGMLQLQSATKNTGDLLVDGMVYIEDDWTVILMVVLDIDLMLDEDLHHIEPILQILMYLVGMSN